MAWTSSDESIATVDNNGKVIAKSPGNCEIIVKTTTEPIIETKIPVEVKEKPKAPEVIQLGSNIPGATYVNGILLVNKNHSIPASYAPGLNQTVWEAFIELKEDAAIAGHDIQLLSGYRSYATQESLYNNYVATYGQEEADTFSAKPGTSEHQTGLAMDVGWIDDAYGETASGKWLAENCHKYGFIIRYPKGKEDITGYKYEPWHIRYLGVDIATDVYQSGLCLEEYLGVQ
ncbi:MAG: D-alanyl-D-alanine carboxypeptidase family protein [Clostridia bacterium]|nr:D-alanyl-D-alanine carboxypeptidase family protein [Clostridia bacterium]